MRSSIPFFFAAMTAWGQINFPPDVYISRVEVVQTVQDEGQNVPLTSGKATAVRAFVKQEGRPESLIANITVALRGFRDGAELAGSPVRAINPAITARPAPDRAVAEHSQNFVLPAAWTAAGPLELRAELRLPAGAVEVPADNNNMTRQVEFFAPPSASPVIAWLPLCIGSSCVSGGAPYQRMAEQLLPFSDGTLRYEDVPAPPVVWNRLPVDAASSEALVGHLKKWLLLLSESPAPAHALAAWLPRGANTAALSGGGGDAFWIVEQAETGLNEQLLARQLADGYRMPADDPCGAFVLDPGFDVVTGLVQQGSKLEFAALCPAASEGFWISAGLAHYLGNGLPAFRVSGSSGGAGRVLVSGTVREDGTVTLTGFLRVSARARTTLSTQSTGWVMRVVDGGGTLDHNVALPSAGPFTISVPTDGNLTSVTLLRDGGEVASASSTSGAPSLTILSPGTGETWNGRNTLRWGATDPAGRLLTYTVSYSADGGATWTPLGVDLQGTELAIDTQYLAGSEARFRVIVSAGLDQAQVVSETVTLGNRPAMQLTGSSIEFGSVTTGQVSDRSLLVKNTGTGRLALEGVTVDREVFRPMQAAPFRVRAGTERGLRVRIAPRAAGPENGTLNFTANDEALTAMAVPMRATVFDRPVPSGTVTPGSLNFGEVPVNQTRELPVTVSNSGTAPLTVTSVSVLNARFTATPASAFTLSPGATRTLLVRFAPNAGGEQAGSLSIASNDPATPSLRVDLRGIGQVVPQPQIDVNRLSLDFGNVNINQVGSLTVDVRNGGNGPLTISALTMSNAVFAVSTPVAPVGVAPGATQVIAVRFSPAAVGAQTGTLTIASNDPLRPAVTVNLSGTGQAAIPAPTPRISYVHPATLGAGSAGFTMTVNGTNFLSSTQAEWNGVSLPTRFLSNTQLRVTVPASTVAAPHTGVVTVSNPLPGGRSNGMSVFVEPPGPSARIVNVDTTGCPTVIHTVTVADSLFLPITALDGSRVTCSEDGLSLAGNLCNLTGAGNRLSTLMILHASVSIADPAKQFLDLGSLQRFARKYIQQTDDLDRIAIIQMDNAVRLRVDFRDAENRDALYDQVNQFLQPQGGLAALFDAVQEGIRQLQTQTNRRKAIIVFTGSKNTFDNNGRRDMDAFSQFLQSSGIPIYVVPIGDVLRDTESVMELNQLALDTGGQFFAEPGTDLEQRMGNLAATLRNQRIINYTTAFRDGQPHQLKAVLLAPGSGAPFTTARSYVGCR
ncbi:MAG: choice-of-anchor D domain-containing protein [Acidobacteria bacterium]|nr:choice-of-anchor D domain-containing protein [Acidobacteriota bacterium]